MTFHEHPDFETLAATVAATLARTCRQSLDDRGEASLALAGGSTPFPVYERLANADLDWSKVTLMPGDERWVRDDDPASNLAAIRRTFDDVPARFGRLVPPRPGPEPTLEDARATLAAVAWPLDACVLGMGQDAHFASLFPGAPGLAEALDPDGSERLTVIHPDPLPEEAPYPRVSLTLAAIAASRSVLLLLRGEGKRAVLKTASREGDALRHPVAALLALDHPDFDIHWSP
ncbi:MAG: 6-phosphogluconolactonase [Wenzhouxiangellaceae bacterium]|nr:6-phosphogluconolactonase [Wenzhouxiangellaceae bacterium]